MESDRKRIRFTYLKEYIIRCKNDVILQHSLVLLYSGNNETEGGEVVVTVQLLKKLSRATIIEISHSTDNYK